MYMSVISKPQHWGGPGPSSAVAPQVIKMRNTAHISCGMLKMQPEVFYENFVYARLGKGPLNMTEYGLGGYS